MVSFIASKHIWEMFIKHTKRSEFKINNYSEQDLHFADFFHSSNAQRQNIVPHVSIPFFGLFTS